MLLSIKQEIAKIMNEIGFEVKPSDIVVPPRAEMGDLAFACFGLAKIAGVNPAEYATDLVEKLSSKLPGVIKTIRATGPYVNFDFDASVYIKGVVSQVLRAENNYGASSGGVGKSLVIEFPSQNTHKEFHIGHLRNACIGNTLVNLYRRSGYRVTAMNYVNDFGAHVVKCLWGMKKFHDGETPPVNAQKWLGEIYAEASNYIKDHEGEVKPELDALQKKLEARDPEVMKVFEETKAWSVAGFAKISKELGIHHDDIIYESEVKDAGQKVVDDLLARGIARIGEGGAIIVDLSEYGLDIALVRKSTGAGVYVTSDLALAEMKFKKYSPDESINITAIEQIHYFKQLFKILELCGFKGKMTHIGYGLVTRPEGKMSSRLGNVILYEDLRSDVFARLETEARARHAEWPDEKIKNNVGVLTDAVLKFTMLKHEAAKNVVFDMKEATSFEGFSAPYILYAVARLRKISRKAGFTKRIFPNYGALTNGVEKKLATMIAGWEEVEKSAFAEYNPSAITRYVFDLAQIVTEFYNECPILKAESRGVGAARLKLVEAAGMVLETALGVLSINVVDEM